MSIKVILATTLAITLLATGFSIYYKASQHKLAVLSEANTKLNIAVEQQKDTIQRIQETYQQQATALSVLLTSNATLSRQKEQLSTKLMKHDLEELSRRKPIMIEKRINDGTKELFNSFNTLSTQ